MALLRSKIGGFAPNYPVVMFARRQVSENRFAPRMILWTNPTTGVVIDGDIKELAAISARVAAHRIRTARGGQENLQSDNNKLKATIEQMATGRTKTATEVSKELRDSARDLYQAITADGQQDLAPSFTSRLKHLSDELDKLLSKRKPDDKQINAVSKKLAGLLLTAAPTADTNLHVDTQFLEWALRSLRLGDFKNEIFRRGTVFYAGKEYKTGIPLGREELKANQVPGYAGGIGEEIPPLPVIKQRLRQLARQRQARQIDAKPQRTQPTAESPPAESPPAEAEQPATAPVQATSRPEAPPVIEAIQDKTGIRRFMPSGIWPWVIGAGGGGLLGYWLRGMSAQEEPTEEPSPVSVVFTPTVPYGHTVIVPQNLPALQAIQSQLGLQNPYQVAPMAQVLPGGTGMTTVIHGPPLPQIVMPGDVRTETQTWRPWQPQMLAPYPRPQGY